MYCKHCGQRVDDDSRFCSSCGKALGAGGTVPLVTTKKGKRRVGLEGILRPMSLLYIFLALACLVPLVFAEYRRIVMGAPLDALYWLSLAPMALSVFFLYLVLGAPVIAEEKEKMLREEGSVTGSRLTTLRCDMLSVCCFIVAIVAFAVSGVMRIF